LFTGKKKIIERTGKCQFSYFFKVEED